jgi:hypothetical protein
VSPQGPDLVLASHIPDVEFGVLVCDGLDVEADGWDRRHVLVELELVEDGYNSSQLAIDQSTRPCEYEAGGVYALVLPAASSPSMRSLISLDPKILFIIFDIDAPMMSVLCKVCSLMWFTGSTQGFR